MAACMKTEAQLRSSVERFSAAFWAKEPGVRPPVGVFNRGMWLPVNYLRRPFPRDVVQPDDVDGSLVVTDYEFASARRDRDLR